MNNIETMKLALEALEDACGERCNAEYNPCFQREAITALRQAIEQAQKQEPVAWGVDWGKAGDIPCVSIIKRLPDGGIEVLACEYAPYTSPPQRQWVGLTDDEIALINADYPHPQGFAKAIQAKLKEKNT